MALWLAGATPACGPAGEPAPLPAQAAPEPVGRMVAAPGLRGFLVWPGDRQPPLDATVVLVDRLDPASKASAIETARTGAVVLVVDAGTETQRARAYVSGLDGVVSAPRVECSREGGCT